MIFLFEKFLETGCWELIKEYYGSDYSDVKNDIEKQLGKCCFSITDIDSFITNIKPYNSDSEYRIVCVGEE